MFNLLVHAKQNRSLQRRIVLLGYSKLLLGAGGIFDPFGLSKGDGGELRLKEIKNGRLAMLAFAGFVAQAQTTGESPLDNLSAHLSDPWAQNVFASKLAFMHYLLIDSNSSCLSTTRS